MITNNEKIWIMTIVIIIAFLLVGAAIVRATPENGGTGSLTVRVLCAHNLFSKEMILSNDIAPDKPISVFLNPSGEFNDRFIAGNYTIILINGNGGQSEIRHFTVYEDYNTLVTFIGHAASANHPTPTPTPTPQ